MQDPDVAPATSSVPDHERPAPLDALDEKLVHALQVAPRASWARLGEVLGVDPATVMRRWERLHSSGRAWITAYPGRRLQEHIEVALIEIDCRSGEVEAVADALAAVPQVVTVEHMAGGRDLLITIFTADLGSLSRLILERIARLPGVTSTRAQMATKMFGDGGRWRLRALTEAQQQNLTGGTAPVRTASRRDEVPVIDATSRSLFPAASVNGRRSVTELAEVTGLSPTTVRRRLRRLIDDHDMMLRCEVARELTEWPVSATLWAQVPADQLETVARGLLTLSEVRLVVSVTGPNNLLFTVWLRSVSDVQRLEAQLAERLPALTLVDRAIALRQTKLMGHLVAPGGRTTEAVPVDIWADTAAPSRGG